jgi:hypothetical protein
MAANKDWLSKTRTGILSMAQDWQPIMYGNKSAWNIPSIAVQELINLTIEAENALNTAQNESTRTPATTAQYKTAFEALTAFMGDSKMGTTGECVNPVRVTDKKT